MALPESSDITVLRWIKVEIEQSLRAAAELLKSSADDSQARQCAQEVHRLSGALQMAGVRGLGSVCDALEGTLATIRPGPSGGPARELIARGIEALGRYVDDLLTGAPNRPMRLFELYSELRRAQGHDKVSPSDLFFPELNVPLPALAATPSDQSPQELTRRARKNYQRGMLLWLRGNGDGIGAMGAAVRNVDELYRASTGFWWVAGVFLHAVKRGAIVADSQVKKICARIDAQLGRIEKGSPSIAESLFRELLYFVANGCTDADSGARAVIQTYGLEAYLPEGAARAREATEDLAARTQELQQLLRTVKDAWSAYCEEGQSELPAFTEQLTALRNASWTHPNTDLRAILEAVGSALTTTAFASAEERAIAVAGAFLVADEVLLAGPVTHATLAPRVRQVLQSLNAAPAPGREGAGEAQVEPAIEQALIGEIIKNLRQVEHHIGAFLKDQSRRVELDEALKYLRQAENIFTMAGAQRAVVVIRHCVEAVQEWQLRSEPPRLPEQESFAQSLTALDFYLHAKARGDTRAEHYVAPILEELGWAEPAQPQVAQKAGRDASSVEVELRQELRATMGVLDSWMQSNASTLAQLEERLQAIYQDAVLVADKHTERSSAHAISMLQQVRNEPLANLPQAIAAIEQQGVPAIQDVPTDIPSDLEIVEVFLEEANEVLDSMATRLPQLGVNAEGTEALLEVRRGFHTLKGSSRMAGLDNFGEAAWSIERLLNYWIDRSLAVNAGLKSLLADSRGAFCSWIRNLQDNGRVKVDSVALREAARQLQAQAESLAGAGKTDARQPAVAAPALNAGASISTTLFSIFQSEASSHVASLNRELDAVRAGQPVRHEFMRAAHTLAGIARTIQVPTLADLSAAVEECLQFHLDAQQAADPGQLALYADAIAELDRMVVQVCNRGGVPEAATGLLSRLQQARRAPGSVDVPAPIGEGAGAVAPEELEETRNALPGIDEIDTDLRDTFLQEALEIASDLGASLQVWREVPNDLQRGASVARALHTLKGSARAVGAMQLGDQVHRIEELVQQALDTGTVRGEMLDRLLNRFDRWCTHFERLLGNGAVVPAAAASEPSEATMERADEQPVAEQSAAASISQAQLRVRADAIERVAGGVGELNIARAQISEELRVARTGAVELSDSVTRLRTQLREIEIQAESQMKARLTRMDERNEDFDPLEFDRFTRLQELSRLMAESLHDIGTVQQNMLRHFQEVDAVLTTHARVNRELHRELTKIQTVPFSSVKDRLQRVLRITSGELGKSASLEIQGAQVELDRRLLEQIVPALEHMIRNSLAHGLEAPQVRLAKQKAESGKITIALRQEGNRVILTLADDGAGLDLARIRNKALARGLIQEADGLSDADIADLIFMPGFSTAEQVTEVSGRGVGMDVVRNAVETAGGEVQVSSQPGQGLIFTLLLPLTLVVMQAVVVRVGERRTAVPAALVGQILRCDEAALEKIQLQSEAVWREEPYAFHDFRRLLGDAESTTRHARNNTVLFLSAGEQRAAIHVDEVLRNEEIPVKEMGPQLARAPGVVGASIGADGRALLIMNPLQLIGRDTGQIRRVLPAPAAQTEAAPLVLIVDDSVTVRKVTSRLMSRAGYRVQTAKDGLEALECLQGERPVSVLLDIEMPRMDGFELAKHIRADARLRDLPLIMISSRTADKHRKHAQALGVDVFLGKPYSEEELLREVARQRGVRTDPATSDSVTA